MKISITITDPADEEHADLYVHEYTAAIKHLADYIESDAYRSMTILCTRGRDSPAQLYPIQCKDIFFIESIDETQIIHTEHEVYKSKKRLYELESLLPANFIRISKAVIINIEKVKNYKPMFNGLMQVRFHNEETAFISRKYLKKVRSKIMEARYEESNQ